MTEFNKNNYIQWKIILKWLFVFVSKSSSMENFATQPNKEILK